MQQTLGCTVYIGTGNSVSSTVSRKRCTFSRASRLRQWAFRIACSMESPRCSAVSCKASLCTLLLSRHSFFKPAVQEIKGYAATIEIQNMEGHSRRNNRSSSLIEEHWLFPATLKMPVKKKKQHSLSTAEAPKAEISDKMYYLNGDTRGIPEDCNIVKGLVHTCDKSDGDSVALSHGNHFCRMVRINFCDKATEFPLLLSVWTGLRVPLVLQPATRPKKIKHASTKTH